MNQVTVKKEKNNYQIEEAYKSLRANLQFCGDDKKVTVGEFLRAIDKELVVTNFVRYTLNAE